MSFRAAARFALRSLLAGGLLIGSAATRADDAPAAANAANLAQETKPADKRPSTARPQAVPMTPQPPAILPPTPPARSNPNEIALANPDAISLGNPAERRYYSLASTPNMLGDVLGEKRFFLRGGNVSLAGGDRGAKIADDGRPLPTDRVFFDYNYFSQANITSNGVLIGLDRYTLGVEKTFLDGLGSIEIKAPIDCGLSSTQNLTAATSANEGTVFGDLSISPKVLLYKTCDWALATGVTFELPTAPDAIFISPPPIDTTATVRDDAVHVEPFLGLQLSPNDRLFSITYLQLDVAANGDRVIDMRGDAPPVRVGKLRDTTLLYADFSAGYWLFHNGPCDFGPCDCGERRYLTGVAPVVELHYATALQDAHPVGDILIVRRRVDILNLTSGLHFEFGPCSTLALGCAVPLRTTARDKEFGTELIVEFNRRF